MKSINPELNTEDLMENEVEFMRIEMELLLNRIKELEGKYARLRIKWKQRKIKKIDKEIAKLEKEILVLKTKSELKLIEEATRLELKGQLEQLKPINYWLDQVPRNLRKRIAKYVDSNNDSVVFSSISNFLTNFVDWEGTDEGPVFWSKLSRLYSDLEEVENDQSDEGIEKFCKSLEEIHWVIVSQTRLERDKGKDE